MNRIKRIALPSVFLFSVTVTNAHAALYDRGNGMIYDSDLNITWLQDANYAATSNYPIAGHSQDDGEGDVYVFPGTMTWAEATTWASNLVYQGISGWRLPSAKLIGNELWSYDGSTDLGSNNTRSELGHLYYELGNTAYYVSYGVFATHWRAPQWTFIDASTGQADSFLNVDGYSYWEAEIDPDDGGAALLFDVIGNQTTDFVGWEFNQAWAVHDGDIANVNSVPVPAAAWLFGSGLLGLVGTVRRRK
jgi:hypothetical protein